MLVSRRGLPLVDAVYGGFSWHPQVNRYYAEEGYSTKSAARFDRVLFGGQVFGCACLAGKRKHFAGGSGFCLSDHFAVLALLDFDAEHARPDRTVSIQRRRRAALLRLRDQELAAERRGDDEANRVGRDEASLMQRRAAEGERAEVDARRRAARELASKRFEQARGAAFGQASLFAELRFARLSEAAAPRRAGLAEAVCSPASLDVVSLRELPCGDAIGSWAYLRRKGGLAHVPAVGGFANVGNTCFVNALLQVLLRLPAVAVWLYHHAAGCVDGAGCLACLVWRSLAALGKRPAIAPALAGTLSEIPRLASFADGGQHDMEEFCTRLLDALRDDEVSAGRCADWPGVASAGGRCCHVDRLFGFVREQRRRCLACGDAAVTTVLQDSGLVVHLPVPEKGDAGRVWTATELYYCSAAPSDVDLFCCACGRDTAHRVQAHVATQPNVLLLHVGRRRGGEGVRSRHAVQPEVVLTLPGHDRYELAAVVYHAGRSANRGHYYCVSRCHDGRWWRFDDATVRVFRGDVERSELRSVYMLVCTLPRGTARFAHMRPFSASEPGGGDGVAVSSGTTEVAAHSSGVAASSSPAAPRLVATFRGAEVAPAVQALRRRQVLRESLPARSSLPPAVVAKEPVVGKMFRVAAVAPAQRVLTSFFAPALRLGLPEDGCQVFEEWPVWTASDEQLSGEQLRFAGGPVPFGEPVQFAPVGTRELVTRRAQSFLKRRKDASVRPSRSIGESSLSDIVGASPRRLPGAAGPRAVGASLLKRRRAAASRSQSTPRVARSRVARRLKRPRVRAKLKRCLKFAKTFWRSWRDSLEAELTAQFVSSRSCDIGSAAVSPIVPPSRSIPTEAEAIEHATGLLLSFGVVRSPAGLSGFLEPKDVGGAGWCFFEALYDQLGSTVIPASKYLAVLAVEAKAVRHEDFAATVVGVDFLGVESPEICAARDALWRVPAYRDLGVVELLTPFECSVLDKFEGVLAGDLLDERRYADDSDMAVLMDSAGFEVLVLESNDVLGSDAAARSRLYPGGERCGQAVLSRLEHGKLDVVLVRYELGSYQHYVSVSFVDGQPWHVSAAKRQSLELAYAASDLCTAVYRSDDDLARLLLLTKLRGADGDFAVGAAGL